MLTREVVELDAPGRVEELTWGSGEEGGPGEKSGGRNDRRSGLGGKKYTLMVGGDQVKRGGKGVASSKGECPFPPNGLFKGRGRILRKRENQRKRDRRQL